jgi:TonB family protein
VPSLRAVAVLALSALLATFARAAGAQPEAPAAASNAALELPKATSDTAVDYPAEGRGEAIVILEIVIDEAGVVTNVEVVEGEEPFARVAAQAAAAWRFVPARQNGRVVPARTRFEVRFVPPREAVQTPSAPAAESASTAPPIAVGPPGAGPPPAEVEILVRGEREPTTTRELTRAEVRQLAGAFGDPFRALESLPGVTPVFSGLPYFYVRGAPPGNQGYFFDGIRVPLLFHFGLGPGVVHPAFVDKLTLYPGAYPARFGRFAGGIIAAEPRAPEAALHGEANVRLFDAGAMVSAPLNEHRGEVTLAGRYSYTAALVSLIAQDVHLEYWDYQARASHALAGGELRVFAFGSFDSFRQSGSNPTALGTEFHRLDLRYGKRIAAWTATAAATVGLDRTHSDDESTTGEDARIALRNRIASVRVDAKRPLSDGHALRTGADVELNRYSVVGRIDVDEDEDIARVLGRRTDVQAGSFLELAWVPTPLISVTPGLRLDVFASSGDVKLGVDPRVLARFEVARHTALLHGLGIVHQAPSFVVPIPGFQTRGVARLQKSAQHHAGVEQELWPGFSGMWTLFHNLGFDTTDSLSLARLPNSEDVRIDSRSLANTFGSELELRGRLAAHTRGALAYTLSRSVRTFGSERRPSAFDRTHVLHLSLYRELGRGWDTSARFVYYSGTPFLDEDAPSSSRLPSFYRLDARVAKSWRLGKQGRLSLVLEGLNVTLSKEVVDRDCVTVIDMSSGAARRSCSDTELGPVTVPSLGVEAAY